MIRLVHFVNTFVTSGGGNGKEESMYDIVMHHLTDHVLTGGIWDTINNNYLNEKIFGIFDMRITKWVLMLWVAMLLCLIVFIPLARKIKRDAMGSTSRWVNMWEALIGFVHDEIVEPNFHGTAKNKAMPYFLTVFFFILFANYIGLVPGAATSTGNLGVTAGLAICTLIGIISVGFIKQGPLWIVKGIVPGGIPLALFPLIWVIELMGMCIKPFALTVRLFANMTAGHVVIIIFIYLVMMFQNYFIGIGSVAGSLMIYLLELLVAFIQAYIFATLSAMFIGEAMHHH
ncbi:MAG: ATP synthase F0 subunit A [Spirochaetae bacterium HGW-Spirochaetae-1]|jgi:F-type H+-transporting ATPase subunit a|nr:MAG: ATP synthase F0 subunit A [Spirochaetae bacterium HGW-Spirochaetae-1]